MRNHFCHRAKSKRRNSKFWSLEIEARWILELYWKSAAKPTSQKSFNFTIWRIWKSSILYKMKRPMPWNEQVDVISSGESSSSDSEVGVQNDGFEFKPSIDDFKIPFKEMAPEGMLIKRAEMYQEYMKQVPIPAHRGSVIPFTTWMGLGKSIKELYVQPLHYLTNIQLKQWDQLRYGSVDEYKPLDTVIHPSKAEATIWLIEEIHRRTSSHHHVAKLWLSDPMHQAYVDSIFPQL